MELIEQITREAAALPPSAQQQALDYIRTLHQRLLEADMDALKNLNTEYREYF